MAAARPAMAKGKKPPFIPGQGKPPGKGAPAAPAQDQAQAGAAKAAAKVKGKKPPAKGK